MLLVIGKIYFLSDNKKDEGIYNNETIQERIKAFDAQQLDATARKEAKVDALPSPKKIQKPTVESMLTKSKSIREYPDSLLIQLFDSSWVTFANNYYEGEAYVEYHYLGNLSDRLAVIRPRLYEGSRYQILDLKSGQNLSFPTFPILSPDQKWLIETGYSNVEEDADPGFRIWGITESHINRVYRSTNIDAKNPHWLDSSSFSICLAPQPMSKCISVNFVLSENSWVHVKTGPDSLMIEDLFPNL